MNDSQDQRQVAARGRRPAVYRALHLTLSLASGAMVGALMFLTFADVVGRYVFNSPILGAYELTEVLMGLLIFAGLPLVSAARKHISIEFIPAVLSPRIRRIQAIGVELLCSAVAGVMAWRIWLYGGRLIQSKETTLELRISRGLIAYAMSVLLMLAAVFFLANAWSITKGTMPPQKKE